MDLLTKDSESGLLGFMTNKTKVEIFLEKYGGLIPTTIAIVFILWYFDVFKSDENLDANYVDSNASNEIIDNPYSHFRTTTLSSRVKWVQLKGSFEGNKTKSRYDSYKFPKEKIINEKKYSGSRMIEVPFKRKNGRDDYLFEVGDKFTFYNLEENKTIEIKSIKFANSLEYIVVEGIDENKTKSHFYITPTLLD